MPMEIHQYWTVPRHTNRGQRRGGCSTIIEEREVSLSRQHPSRTGLSSRRECNHRSHNNLLQNLADRRMANSMDPVLRHHKGNLQQCQSYRTKSLISHPSKVMLKIILNRLNPQAEKIIAEEQAGFIAGRSTTEQIFNLRILRTLSTGLKKRRRSCDPLCPWPLGAAPRP